MSLNIVQTSEKKPPQLRIIPIGAAGEGDGATGAGDTDALERVKRELAEATARLSELQAKVVRPKVVLTRPKRSMRLSRPKPAAKLSSKRPSMLGPGDPPTIEQLTANPNFLTYKLGGTDWVLNHNRDFYDFINNHFRHYALTSAKFQLSVDGKQEPFPYQSLVRDYVGYGTPYRGVLLNHGLGSGKTRSTVMIAETMRANGIPILFFGPASLRENFREELLRWGSDDLRLPSDYKSLSPARRVQLLMERQATINSWYKFVSSNANNSLIQLARLGIGHPKLEDNSKRVQAWLKRQDHPIKLDYPKKMLLIMEEAHNANQSYTSKSATVLPDIYELFSRAIDCKVVALTATPIINNPFEICTLFNLLAGPIINPSTGKRSTLLPETEEEFNHLFIDYDRETPTIREDAVSLLSRRLAGRISYYKGISDDLDLFPEVIVHEDQYVVMSARQREIHDETLQDELTKEIDETARSRRTKGARAPGADAEAERAARNVPPAGAMHQQLNMNLNNSYRSGTRAICNYVWPRDRPKPISLNKIDFRFKFNVPVDPVEIMESEVSDEEKLELLTNVLRLLWIEDEPESPEEAMALIEAYEDPATHRGELLVSRSVETEDGPQVLSSGLKQDILTKIILRKLTKIPPQKLLTTFETTVMYHNQEADLTATLASYTRTRNKKSQVMPDAVRELLTTDDYDNYLQAVLPRSVLIINMLTDMAKDPDTYFSDSVLGSEHDGLSRKMLQIYHNITGIGQEEPKPGVMRIVPGPSTDPVTEDTVEAAAAQELEQLAEREQDELDRQEGEQDIEEKLEQEVDPGQDPEAEQLDEEQLLEEADDGAHPTLSVYDSQIKLYDEALLSRTGTQHIEGGPALVYSEFNHGEGIGVFRRILQTRGYEDFSPDKYDIDRIEKTPMKARYAIITGDVKMETRGQIIKFFNHPRNRHGQLIRIMLITSAASEGISLFYLRQVHIMEPFWHNVRIRQVVGRAQRLLSHKRLPLDQRNAHVYKYYSVHNKDTVVKDTPQTMVVGVLRGREDGGARRPDRILMTAKDETTDLYLRAVAIRKDKLIDSVTKIMKGAAIDCVLNAAQNRPEEQGYRCFSVPKATGKMSKVLYAGKLDDDVNTDVGIKVFTKNVQLKPIAKRLKVNGVERRLGYLQNDRGQPLEEHTVIFDSIKHVKKALNRSGVHRALTGAGITITDASAIKLVMTPLYDADVARNTGSRVALAYLLFNTPIIFPREWVERQS